MPPSPSDRLELILITPQGNLIRRSTTATRAEVLKMVQKFREQVTNRSVATGTVSPAQGRGAPTGRKAGNESWQF